MSILAVFYPKNRAQDGIRRTFAANTAEEVQLPGRYTVFILTADAANTTKVYFILNETATGTDPTVLSGDAANGSLGLMPGQQMLLVIPDHLKTYYFRVKSAALGAIDVDGIDVANAQASML